MEFNGFCHAMAKSNWSSAYNYITDIFNNSVGYKDKCNKIIKASLLTVRGFLLYIPFVNRITQLALRILSPELTREFIESPSCFGKEELKIRYSKKVLLSYFLQASQAPGSFNQLHREDEEYEILDEGELMEIFDSFESPEDFQEALQDPSGPFSCLNQEEKQQMLQLYSIFLKNPEEFQNMLPTNSLQGVSQEEDFPYLINNDPNAFKQLVQGQENVFRPLSEEEQSNLDNWAKEVNLGKDVSVTNTTKIQNGLDELD